MAQPTTPTHTPAQPQHDTPGVGKQGAAPEVKPGEPAKPVLFEDIDPVLLVRLYPGAKDAAEMRAQAEKAGQEVAEAGAKIIASQQEPITGFDEHGVPIPGPGGTQGPNAHPTPPPPPHKPAA